MDKLIISDLDLQNKTVLMRVDFNVPLKESGAIANDNRIQAALPTIKYAMEHQAKLVLFSHLGRVKTEADKQKLSLRSVAERLATLLDHEILFVPETRGAELEKTVKYMQPGEIALVENTRFEDLDGKKESGNNVELGQYWASLGDIFVNDAFGTAHRKHASNVGIATAMKTAGKPVAAGFLMEKEIKFLSSTVEHPQRPFVAILGGAKVSDKIKVIQNLVQKADKVLIGGGMAYTFLAAKGRKIGQSLFEEETLPVAENLLQKYADKLVLPIDVIVTDEITSTANSHVVEGDIADNEMGVDIGPKTIALFEDNLSDAQTVVWNGPMGVFEVDQFAKGTLAIGKYVGESKATSIVGGGDSTAAIQKLGLADEITHISTGGGASLKFLEGSELPGITVIDNK